MTEPSRAVCPLRVGVVNLMPRLETYEPSLVSLATRTHEAGSPEVALVWLRLATHGYRSSDPAHLAARYVSYEKALADRPLDGVLLTGAPVEHLPLSEVRYWPELSELLDHATEASRSVLGICWGAMALGEREGLRKSVFARKVSGVFEHRVPARGEAALPLGSRSFVCPHSRFAGFERDEVERAQADGRLVCVGDAGDAGPAVLATPNARVVMHLGHPEYDDSRLPYEWARDQAAGRTDVGPPEGYDLSSGRPVRDWTHDSVAFFRAWLARLMPVP